MRARKKASLIAYYLEYIRYWVQVEEPGRNSSSKVIEALFSRLLFCAPKGGVCVALALHTPHIPPCFYDASTRLTSVLFTAVLFSVSCRSRQTLRVLALARSLDSP